jgi:hypothetical protein
MPDTMNDEARDTLVAMAGHSYRLTRGALLKSVSDALESDRSRGAITSNVDEFMAWRHRQIELMSWLVKDVAVSRIAEYVDHMTSFARGHINAGTEPDYVQIRTAACAAVGQPASP